MSPPSPAHPPTADPVAVGLAGAGPWATAVTAPILAAGPETRLAGVWSRTAEHAARLAAAHGVPSFERYEEMLDACEAVACAVAPAAQPGLAVAAARRGKALLLEKPVAVDVAGAEAVAAAVAEAGVGSMVVLTYRYAAPVRAFLAEAATFDALGGRGCFLSGAFLGGPFATGWRIDEGCLLDVGPHLLDLLDAALGPVVDVRGGGDVHGWVALTLAHESGATSQASLCCRAGIESRTEVEVFGPAGVLAVDGRRAGRADPFATIRAEFAATARGAPHPLDAARGLHLQRVLDAAARALGGL